MKIKFVVRTDDNSIIRIHGSLRAALDESRQYLQEVGEGQLKKMRKLLELSKHEVGDAWMFYNSETEKDPYDIKKLRSASVTVCEDVS